MKRWMFITLWVAVPSITLQTIVMALMLYRRLQSWMLVVAVLGLSLSCVAALRQMYLFRADGKVAAIIGGVYGTAAGSMLITLVAILDKITELPSVVR